jgi:hypothetical protein
MFYPKHKKKIFDNISICCKLCLSKKNVEWNDSMINSQIIYENTGQSDTGNN